MADDFPEGDGYDDLSEPEFPLPDGVTKEILIEAATSQWLKPKVGDEVTIHFVAKQSGTSSQESDFIEFDSSKENGEPMSFTLGKEEVVKGLELGIPTMRKGELAKFKMTPEFGYGPVGTSKVPGGATLIYEVELISWKVRTDLFTDGSVIKTTMEEGTGWKTPHLKEEVCLSITIACGGSIQRELTDFEYTLGSDKLGAASAVVDRCLVGMKKLEVALLNCNKELDFGDGLKSSDLAVTITLKEIYETKDVSFEKDKSLIKKQIIEGQGYETPKDGSTVHLVVEAAMNGREVFPSFQKKLLDFVSGDGQVPDALELAIMDMKKGEKAILHVKRPQDVVKQLGLPDSESNDEIFLTMVLDSFEQAPALGMDESAQKVERAAARKEVGTKHFKAGRFAMAVLRYKSVTDILNYVEHFEDEIKGKAKDLRLTCELNKAACYLKLQMFAEAKTACRIVLDEQGQNVKALFRRAQAEIGLKNFGECISDCKKVLQLDQENRDAKLLLRQAVSGQKEADKKSKAVFASMCKALGKESNETKDEALPRQEPTLIQEKGVKSPGIVSTLFQGVSRAFFFFPNLVFSNFSYFLGYFWQRLSGKTRNGPGG